MRELRHIALACALVLAASPAEAFTYLYVGNPFSYSYSNPGGSGPVDPSLGDHVTASITFNIDFGPNYTGGSFGGVADWSISDGVQILSKSQGNYLALANLNFTKGLVTSWAIDATTSATATSGFDINTYGIGIPNDGAQSFVVESGFIAYTANIVLNDPGMWNAPNGAGGPPGGIPEPAAWLLIILGFAGLGGRLRQQRSAYRRV